ncbi:MAG: MFS transporter [Bacteroidales bacterium]|nr:MFS transporter [Bacteroidales bacterium]
MLLNESPTITRQHYRILGLSWAGWVFDFYDLILFTFLLIMIRQDFHLTDIEISYILGASLAATAVGGIIFGVLADKFGRRPVLQWTILTYSVGTFFCGFASSFWFLMIFRVLTGLGVGGEWATGQTYVGETFPANVRGRYCAFMQTGAPLGIALAAIVGGLVAPHIGWRASFFISILPALLIIYIRKKLPESDLWLAQVNRRTGGQAGKRTSGKGIREILLGEENKLLILFSKAHRKFFILALILAIFDMTAYWFTYSWMPSYLHAERGFTLTKSALWMLVIQSGGFLGYASFGFVSDRWGRRPAYTFYSFIMAAGLLMITLFWSTVVVYPPVILGFMFLVGFGTGMFGGYGALFSELFPTSIRSTAMGTAFNLARGVQFVTPVIITVVAVHYGLSGGIALAALFAILTGLWIWAFPETRGKRLEE